MENGLNIEGSRWYDARLAPRELGALAQRSGGPDGSTLALQGSAGGEGGLQKEIASRTSR